MLTDNQSHGPGHIIQRCTDNTRDLVRIQSSMGSSRLSDGHARLSVGYVCIWLCASIFITLTGCLPEPSSNDGGGATAQAGGVDNTDSDLTSMDESAPNGAGQDVGAGGAKGGAATGPTMSETTSAGGTDELGSAPNDETDIVGGAEMSTVDEAPMMVPSNDGPTAGVPSVDTTGSSAGVAVDDLPGFDVGGEPAEDPVDQSPCGALVSCQNECVDQMGDSRHCGGCGNTCGVAQGCINGQCVEVGFACADRWLGSVGHGVTLTGNTRGLGSDIHGLCLRSGHNDDTLMHWRAPVSGEWTIIFNSRDFDVVAGIQIPFMPILCVGNEIACDDDGLNMDSARLTFNAMAGQDFLIQVDAFRESGSGQFSMAFSVLAAP